MARTLTKAPNPKEFLYSQLQRAITVNTNSDEPAEEITWLEVPVGIQEFCSKFLREPLFPKQLELCEAMTGTDPMNWQKKYKNGNAFWGKGSGKDRTIAKLLAYIVYKLLCMNNPQKILREKFNCSLGEGAPIDLGNMSINARQAQNVFFNNLTVVIRQAINPDTGVNWFTEHGADLREGYGIQNSEIQFPHNITAHSLNGETHVGEGLNLFFGVVDEFGAMTPTKKAFELLEAIRSSVLSRYGAVGKVCTLSYKYAENDPMHVLFEKELTDPETFSSRAATWEVNPYRVKEDFAAQYRKDLEKAKMTYECLGGSQSGGIFIKKKNLIAKIFSPKLLNPLVKGYESVSSNKLMNLDFHNWFIGRPNRQYVVHVDLAKGKIEDRGDAAGLSLAHCRYLKPKIDDETKAELLNEGFTWPTNDNFEEPMQGVVIDLALQLVAPSGSEIDFTEIREFVFWLKNQRGFDIILITYDQWGSAESIQEFNRNGVDAEVLSVDRKNDSYLLFKDLVYKQIFKCYPHSILKREYSELVYNDKGKIDHPARSYLRDATEGVSAGSKDVSDATVGCVTTALERISLDSGLILL